MGLLFVNVSLSKIESKSIKINYERCFGGGPDGYIESANEKRSQNEMSEICVNLKSTISFTLLLVSE